MGTAKKKYPVSAKDYKLQEEIGEGVSASVYRALCVPLNEIVAIKVLDLEKCNNDLDGIRREVQTMSLINHPNLIQSYCSFTTGHKLWVVMPYMSGGSCLHIMKSSFPDGFEEPVIATFLCEVLKALVYLHAHGHIHRDVKAGNILVDFNGSIKLADFGVSACMFDAGDRQRSRNTFVGTPCWMAPEVMQQLNGYDFKADMWSFGITALELAHGHAPFSKYPPMKVLLMTLQNAPPGLDYERDKRFSKSFKDMVAACLVKDPKKRPSSEKLMKHPFFKHAKTADYLERSVLDGLSPLADRFKMLKADEADLLIQNKELYEDKEHLSQKEYIRGISAWNFNLEDLKNQAAISTVDEPDKQNGISDDNLNAKTQDADDEIISLENSFASFPMPPLKALKELFDTCKDDVATDSPTEESPTDKDDIKQLERIHSLQKTTNHGPRKYMSGPLLPDNVISPKKLVINGERDYHQLKFQAERSNSGPLQYIQRNNMTSSLSENISEGAVVRQKGRFRITEADSSPKAPTSGVSAASVLPSLQSILQHNIIQREEILRLFKFVDQNPGSSSSADTDEHLETGNSDFSQIPPTPRERELQSQVIQLQQSIESLVEQLQKQKTRNVQLEKQLSGLVKQNTINE